MNAKYVADAEARVKALRAVALNDLKFFLREHFLFRAQVHFKKATGKSQVTNQHRFGNEHNCTLNQLRAGYVKKIVLNRAKGLTDLFKMIEVNYDGQIKRATVYMRDLRGEPFDRIIRIYDSNGNITEDNIPELIPGDKELFFSGMVDGLPVITEEPLPNFNAEISNHLLNSTTAA